MSKSTVRSEHTFHIPVMGTGFTIDTPLRVAKYGISSAISLVDDSLIEQIRKYHCEQHGEAYEEIPSSDDDPRANRITAYLNLLDRLVARQVKKLQASPFEPGSEITKYFELLPDSALKQKYLEMLSCNNFGEKARLQEQLRPAAVPGSIDVNIMSKGDSNAYRDGKKRPQKYSDAMAALRGFGSSTLKGSIVFSAGMNPHLYSYVAEFDDFFPDEDGLLKKKIILKVSDYRSAVIQGKFFAKRGLWVSEYRIESGLNCGGHAFATKGLLMGPILEEFKQKKTELRDQLHRMYTKGLKAIGRKVINEPLETLITAQGGIGTPEENDFLRKRYNVDSTGWGTPFMLVPEAVCLDDEHLGKLLKATEEDVILSDNSPFGLPFWNLKNSGSENARRSRIEQDTPGSVCRKTHVRFNSEFTEIPICTASRNYQRRKLKQIENDGLTEEQRLWFGEHVLAKSCICHDLGGCITIKYGIDPDASPALCPGPGIADFSKAATLKEMVDHIYGRKSLPLRGDRKQMFLKEIELYVDYVRQEIKLHRMKIVPRPDGYFAGVKESLLNGIDYYKNIAGDMPLENDEKFLDELKLQRKEAEIILSVEEEEQV